jgi:hypothetical protein
MMHTHINNDNNNSNNSSSFSLFKKNDLIYHVIRIVLSAIVFFLPVSECYVIHSTEQLSSAVTVLFTSYTISSTVFDNSCINNLTYFIDYYC